MRRTPILTLLLLVVLTVVFVLGTGVDGAAAATVTRYQQNAAQLTYTGTWSVGSATAASGGSYRYANASGHGGDRHLQRHVPRLDQPRKRPTYGIATVSVDGGAPVTVDLYNDVGAVSAEGLGNGHSTAGYHTVRIEWTGTRNAAATNTNIGVDAFDVAGTLVGGDPRRADRPAPGLARELDQGLDHLVLRRHRLVRQLGRIVA